MSGIQGASRARGEGHGSRGKGPFVEWDPVVILRENGDNEEGYGSGRCHCSGKRGVALESCCFTNRKAIEY